MIVLTFQSVVSYPFKENVDEEGSSHQELIT